MDRDLALLKEQVKEMDQLRAKLKEMEKLKERVKLLEKSVKEEREAKLQYNESLLYVLIIINLFSTINIILFCSFIYCLFIG